jgi:hypothetical protein
MADFSGGLFRRVILAHLFGGFSWLMEQAGFWQKEKEEKCILSKSVNCIMTIICSQ